jgi:lipopolysaccharide transport system permease protein
MHENLSVKIYTPHSSIKNLSALIGDILNSFKMANQLGYTLAQRDIKSQYRQSFLGIFWAFINPLFNTILWIFLSKSGVVQIVDTPIPYPLYVFIGTMLWGIFTDSITSPITQTNAAKGILTKINFPVEAIIVSTLYQNIFNASFIWDRNIF